MASLCQRQFALRTRQRIIVCRGHIDQKQNECRSWLRWIGFSAPAGPSVHQAFYHCFTHMKWLTLYCGLAVRLFLEFAWGGDVGLNSESAFKPYYRQLLCVRLCFTFQGDWPFASWGLLLKRDTGLLNVSPRREPCYPLCSFFMWVLWCGTWVWLGDGKPGATPLS